MNAEVARVRIEELRLGGFRAFENARLTLDDVTVLVGRNGAGKSTIVDAFEFLREALTDSLENALERRGGIQSVMRKGARSLALAVRLTLPPEYIRRVSRGTSARWARHPTNYEPVENFEAIYGFRLRTTKGGKGFFVADEVARCGGFSFTSEQASGSAEEAPALSLPLTSTAALETRLVHEALLAASFAYKFSPSAIRAEPAIGRVVPLHRDGGNLGDVLKRVEKEKDDLTWIVRHLGAITPGIVSLKSGTAAGRRIVQFLQSAGGAKTDRFEIGDMSDGTLRSLAILLALRQTPTPALVCIDEIEDSVHPAALAVLLDAVSASTERCQVLLTSHSPEALSHPAVTAARVRVAEWRDGRSEIFRLSPGAEQSSRPPRSVGTLLRTNALFTAESPERVEGDFFEGG